MDKMTLENMSISIRMFLLQHNINTSLELLEEKLQDAFQKGNEEKTFIINKQELALNFGSATPMFRQMFLTVQVMVRKVGEAYFGHLMLHYNFEVSSHGTNGTTATFYVIPTGDPNIQKNIEYIVLDERAFFVIRNWHEYLEKQRTSQKNS